MNNNLLKEAFECYKELHYNSNQEDLASYNYPNFIRIDCSNDEFKSKDFLSQFKKYELKDFIREPFQNEYPINLYYDVECVQIKNDVFKYNREFRPILFNFIITLIENEVNKIIHYLYDDYLTIGGDKKFNISIKFLDNKKNDSENIVSITIANDSLTRLNTELDNKFENYDVIWELLFSNSFQHNIYFEPYWQQKGFSRFKIDEIKRLIAYCKEKYNFDNVINN
ncbi:hypothetical protein SY27_14945 [Flavobacterium sp. 316]|uniref:hypothetical protein n=1 Tax=Flavobacterium sp. 316 TaxID=1603293 RepID=UPI0005DB38AF|nr:hypothetical protein [Flavobacterium sp. 316]KIX20402.1 hypothetical protein SY27_14945 [Flavobacterium sp. 316]